MQLQWTPSITDYAQGMHSALITYFERHIITNKMRQKHMWNENDNEYVLKGFYRTNYRGMKITLSDI